MSTLTPDMQRVLDAVPTGLFVGGSWREATGGGTLEVTDPATGDVLTTVADATPADAVAALDAAHAAQAAWAATPPRERADVLHRAYALMIERTEDLALLMTLEMGKSLAESRAEVAYAAEFLRWFSEEAVRVNGRFSDAPAGNGVAAGDEAAGRAVPAHHPVELPRRDGYPQDRPGAGGRLHRGGQAGASSRRCRCWRWSTSCARPAPPTGW